MTFFLSYCMLMPWYPFLHSRPTGRYRELQTPSTGECSPAATIPASRRLQFHCLRKQGLRLYPVLPQPHYEADLSARTDPAAHHRLSVDCVTGCASGSVTRKTVRRSFRCAARHGATETTNPQGARDLPAAKQGQKGGRVAKAPM